MKIVINRCALCKKPFKKTSNVQKFCSYLCQYKSRKNYIKQWILRNPNYLVLKGAKGRAKRDGLEFDLEYEDIVIPAVCPVLGIPLKRNIGSGFHNDSPSIDRLDNNKGYTKDNICIISNRANLLKCDATIEELEKVIQYMKDYNARRV